MRSRVALAVAGAVLVGGLATACDDGPPCLRSHVEIQWTPVYNPTLKTTTLQPNYIPVCDKYGKAKK